MGRGRIERVCLVGDKIRPQRHAPAQARRKRRRPLVDLDLQRRAVPIHVAGADRDAVRAAREIAASALCHRPTVLAGAVERDVHGAVIFRIAPVCPRIIG